MFTIRGRLVSVVLWLSFLSLTCISQTVSKPLSFHTGAAVFRTTVNEKTAVLNSAATVLGLSRYLSPGFDFQTEMLVGSSFRESNTYYFIDANYSFILKLNNGIFWRENILLAPFLRIGLGGSWSRAFPDAYTPLGAGLSLKLTSQWKLNMAFIHRLSFNQSLQPTQVQLSLSYKMPSRTIIQDSIDWESAGKVELALGRLVMDTDGDGLYDRQDQCPKTPGSPSKYGCPDQALTQKPLLSVNASTVDQDYRATDEHTEKSYDICITSKSDLESISNIYFGLNSSRLTKESLDAIGKYAEILKRCRKIRIEIKAFSSQNERSSSDLEISMERAMEIKRHFVFTHNISQSRIYVSSFGSKKAHTREKPELNRRCELSIISM